MDAALKSLIIGKAVEWFNQQHNGLQITAVLDEHQSADVYGEHVLAWYVELVGNDMVPPLGVEVAIDMDGCVSVNRIEPNILKLQHLWPVQRA